MLQKLAVVALSVGLLATVAYGQQSGAATLNGTITDQSGAAVPAAKVTVSQAAIGLTRTTETTNSGLYAFPSLPVGGYTISVEKSGFGPAKAENVDLSIGTTSTLDFKLQVGTTTETVNVTTEAPLVETSQSQTSTVIDNKSVSDLPINGRNFLDFTLLTPGVVLDRSRTGDLSFGGQRGTANSVQIDGSDSNNSFFGQAMGRTGTGRNPYSFSQDSVQEFQVNANTYAPELGRAGGGVINVITKSGTNDFHGTAFEFFRDKALNANSWENNRAGSPRRNYHYNQFGATLGGPIKKNKAFFFFDYDGQRNSEPIVVFFAGGTAPADADSQRGVALLQKYLGAYPRSLNNNVYLFKSDVNLSDSQRISVRYNANRFNGVNYENSGNQSALEHTGNADVTTDNVAGTHSWVLSPKALLESRVSFTRDNEPGASNSTAPEAVIQNGGNTVINIGRNNFSPRFTNAKTFQWAEGFSYTRDRHSYKIGSDFIFQRIGNFFPGLFSGTFTFPSYAAFALGQPSQYRQAFAGAGTDGALTHPNVNEYAFYVQDSWRVSNRLTLNYGARYDLFDYAAGTVKNTDAGLAALNLDTARINLDKNNLSVRLGFAYRVSDSGNLTVRGGYGMFVGRTPAIITGTSLSQNGIQVQTYTLTSNFPTYPNVLSAPPALNRTPDIYVFDPNYQQPTSHQWSLNLQRQIGKSYSVQVGYLGVKGTNLTRTRDINLFPAVATAGTLADGTPVTFARRPSGRPNANFGRISLFDSGAASIYHSGFIQVNKRLAQNFQLMASYTLAKVIDTKPDATSVVVGTDDAKNAQDTLNPDGERGRGNADIRHRFIFSGVWDINYAKRVKSAMLRNIIGGYQLSVVSTLQSGRPYTATVGSDPNNDGNISTDRPFALGRNTFEGAGLAQVDMRFTRDIALYKERVALRLMFEAFNLTNRVNFNNYNLSQYSFSASAFRFTPNASFFTPTSTSPNDPRILQLGAKITF
ncbi:MAG: carboxypeptidase regulatory-like domain-containing protein [Bryobacteraceae bacterium]